MSLRIETPRGVAASLDPAIVAAIAIAVRACQGASEPQEAPSQSSWRTAGRSIEAFDAYDAARFAHVARRGGSRA